MQRYRLVVQRMRRWLRQEPDGATPVRATLYVHLRSDLGISP
jgi:hypothetical protein